MSYQDDLIRQQRQHQQAPKIKMSRAEMEAQMKMLTDIVVGNKKRIDDGVVKEGEKQEVLLKDGFKYLDKKPGRNQKESDEKMQTIVDYYGG